MLGLKKAAAPSTLHLEPWLKTIHWHPHIQIEEDVLRWVNEKLDSSCATPPAIGDKALPASTGPVRINSLSDPKLGEGWVSNERVVIEMKGRSRVLFTVVTPLNRWRCGTYSAKAHT